jgi:hypothetical protein
VTVPDGSENDWNFKLFLDGVLVGDGLGLTGADGILNFGTLQDPGAYKIVETTQTTWDPTDCQSDVNSANNQDCTSFTVCEFDVSYPANAGDLFTCTFTNTQRGKIIVEKQTEPDASLQSFEFDTSYDDANFFLTDGQSDDSGFLVPDSYTVQEIVPAAWDLTVLTCTEDQAENSTTSLETATASITLDPGETVTCVFTNTERGMADVTKTVDGLPPTGDQSFDFQIRQGASPDSVGIAVAAATANATSNVEVPFVCVAGDPPCRDVEGVAKLVPGDYQFCEVNVMPGWTSNIKDFVNAFPLIQINGDFFVPDENDPMHDNSVYCAPFTLAAGDTVSFAVDNTPPPGGDARTPGFWKNWSECTGGNQDDVLGDSIECSVSGFFWIGNAQVDECYEAVSLLDMRMIDESLRGKKKANDACYLLASKLLAARLNTTPCIGANNCAALQGVISDANQLLVDEEFDGTNNKCLTSKYDRYSEAIDYAEQLDAYLNNEPGSLCN